MKLKLKEFDLKRIKPHRIILFIGRRGTGKSTLMYDVAYNLRDRFNFGCAMTPTVPSARTFRKFLPAGLVFEEGYNEDQLEKMLRIGKEIKRQNKNKSGVIFLDDCMADKKLFKGSIIRDMAMNGRHYNLTFINAMQYLMDIGSDIRTQIDYIFVLKEPILANRERLHKYFFGMFKNRNNFYDTLDKCTQNHECLVLDNTGDTSNIDKCIGWYKAKREEQLPAFQLLDPVYWKMDYQYRRREDTSSQNILKPSLEVVDNFNNNDPIDGIIRVTNDHLRNDSEFNYKKDRTSRQRRRKRKNDQHSDSDDHNDCSQKHSRRQDKRSQIIYPPSQYNQYKSPAPPPPAQLKSKISTASVQLNNKNNHRRQQRYPLANPTIY